MPKLINNDKKSTKTEKSSKPAPPKNIPLQAIDYYKQMLLIRRLEERVGQMYGMGLISGFCHLYIGQEAVVVGIEAGLVEGDALVTGYRDQGHMLLRGDINGVLAELTGRAGGCSQGKGGSMHMFNPDRHFYGGHGIVGAQVPLGTGIAFAMKYRKENNICVTCFGDGAANQGQVYESFNMAELWQLPALYVIENNQYAMGTSLARASSQTALHRRGESFNIPGQAVNGMDVLAIKKAVAEAATWCRSGKGPYLLEMLTYRYRGHSMSDPGKYRTKEEVQKVRSEHDPIDSLQKKLIASNMVDEAGFDKIDQEVKEIIAQAVAFAQDSPLPLESELMTDVFV